MKNLASTLEHQAQQARPTPDLGNVYQRVQRRHRRAKTGRKAITLAVGVGVIGMLVGVANLRSNNSAPAIAPTRQPTEIQLDSVGGLTVASAGDDQSYQNTTLERSNPGAQAGPYSVVVRRTDGSLGSASAVVTYPVEDGGPDDEIRMNPPTGVSTMTATRSGGRFVVRAANLSADEITAIANATSIVNGRPVVNLGLSLTSFRLVAAGPQHPTLIREARFGCDALGEESVLGAFCYTGFTTSPGFEDAVYTTGFEPGPLVDGHPSVISSVGGGNATLAWEPQPGIVAYIGYSGVSLGGEQAAALARLAGRATILSPAEWSATRPQVVTQSTQW